MALTQIDQTTFDQVIQGHKDVHQFIVEQQGTIADEVDTAESQNHGEMINSLVNVHRDWADKMKDIMTNLESMISNLETTKIKLMSQDETNIIR